MNLSGPVDLEPGTYWIALINTSTYEEAAFFWTYNDRGALAAYNEGGIEDPFQSTNFRLVYSLQDTKFVPEPSGLVLSGLGMSLTLLPRKRRKA